MISSAFKHNGNIPSKFTCDGKDIPPPLSWSGVPKDTKSFALIMTDPDVPNGIFVHWLVWNIPGKDKFIISERSKLSGAKPSKMVTGTTSFGKTGYGGPCPPSGEHRYVFELYALNTDKIKLDKSITITMLDLTIKQHVIGKAVLIGKYKKK